MDGGQKTSDRANWKELLALTVRSERRLRRIVSSQRNQTLARIITRLNGGASRSQLRIWHQAHEAIDLSCQVGTAQGHGDSIMVCGLISRPCLGSLVHEPTSLNAIRYVELVAGRAPPSVYAVLLFARCQVIYSPFGLAIHQNDHQARRRFVEWAQNEMAVVPDFHKRILFSDEAHFWLNGYVNKQNCRIWREANPQVYVETPLHPEKLTFWCTLWAGGIIGPYFFKNDEGHNVTVNGDRYRAMITNFFIPELNNHDVQEPWFQQDGATCHTARATIDLLKDTFRDRLISRFRPVNWPPRSCDLTPLDYFLRGYVKSLVYADKPQTLDHLEDNIRRVIADIRPQMLEKVIENWTSRLDYIRASRGSPMPEIIF
ncbi:DUF4817 domain-containing protein [Trichonephila clavipes]|nr:DUF4817 domain-containing protein [Trichonephila clavipes]